ncbi:MAG TPA: glycosyltransferase 87 family protein [Acidimicrobiales bacterium]|jgi:alpha-1,2-mannosyltransferase|nr:glycosyltransferase 87 family protein [Acidimicrobiales bacterium]
MSLARIRATPTWVVATAAAVVWLASAGFMVHFGTHWHLDLRVYRAAGHALFHGGSPFTGFYTESHLPFTYPPFALLVLSPLSLAPLGLIEALWWLASSTALVFSLYRLMTVSTAEVAHRAAAAPSDLGSAAAPSDPGMAMSRADLGMAKSRALAVAALLGATATLVLEPVRSNMDYAQINVLLMLLVVVDLTNQQTTRTWWRGCLVGLAGAIKLTPLLYLAAFVVRRDWRSLARGVGTFVAATAASWLILPSDSNLYWFHQATDAQRTGPIAIVSNQSWNGLLRRPPFHWGSLTAVLWAILVIATVACGVFLAARLTAEHRTAETVMTLGLTELLVSPVSWTHHWSWVAIAPIAAVSLWRVHRAVAWLLVVLVALAVTAPYLWIQHGPLSYVAGNALVLMAAAVLVVWTASEWALWAQDLPRPRLRSWLRPRVRPRAERLQPGTR